MSTLIENVAKVEAANAAIGNAIAAFGVTVPEGSKLSDKPALIGKIPHPGPSGWGRPKDWPRIDLIPMRGLATGMAYFILRKPEDAANHGFALAGTTSNGLPWFMERVTVSDDGLAVAAVAGSTQETPSGNTICAFAFPEEDPAGTVYAMRVRASDGAGILLRSAVSPDSKIRQSQFYSSNVILEAIIRTKSSYPSMSFASGTYEFSGVRHVVYYGAKGFSPVGFRANQTLEFLEFREGSTLNVDPTNLIPSFNSSPSLRMDWDDDTVVAIKPNYANIGMRVLPSRCDGTMYPLGNVIDATTGQPIAWGDQTGGISSMFNGNSLMRSISLPEGFGSKATSITNAFSSCTSLCELVLPEGFGSKATSITNAFRNCSNLATLHIPEGFGQSVNATSNASYLFFGCASLMNVNRAPALKVSFGMDTNTALTHESLVNILTTLVPVTTAQTLTLGATNLAKLTDEEMKVATDKGWTLA